MLTKTRNVVAASAVVLGFGLGTGLVAYFVGVQSTGAQRLDDLRLVPANVALVASADVHAIMSSPLRERLRLLLPDTAGRGQAAFAEQTGINIDTDIDRVIAATGRRDAAESGADALVLARGRFDVVRIEAFMREKGGEVEEFAGKRLIVGRTERGRPGLTLAFMEPGLIAVGSDAMVRIAVGLDRGGDSLASSEEVMGRVRALPAGDAWVVGRFDELMARTNLPATVGGRMPAVQWVSASVDVDGGIRGLVRAEGRDDQAGESLRDVVRGVVALARLQSGRHPQIDAALQTLVLGGDGRTVDLGFDLPADLFEALSALHAPAPQAQ